MTEYPPTTPYGGAAPLDPEAATGPQWPRLVATTPGYQSPPLIKWPIFVSVILYVAYMVMMVSLSLFMQDFAPSDGSMYGPNGSSYGSEFEQYDPMAP